MSSKKAARRPKAHKQVLIEAVDGYQLTPEQHAEYKRTVGSPLESAALEDKRRALRNVLYRHRASVQMHDKNKLEHLGMGLTEVGVEIASVGKMYWPTRDAALRGFGCAAIEHLAGKLEAAAKEMRGLSSAIAKEAPQA